MINVIGLGPGNTDYITKLGEKLIQNSDVVIGGKRNLESIIDFEGEKIEISSNLKEIVEYINNNKHKQISVIASGDPLIYGIGRYLSKNIDKEDFLAHLYDVEAVPTLISIENGEIIQKSVGLIPHYMLDKIFEPV